MSRRTQDPERREPGFVYWTITISGVAFQPLRLPDFFRNSKVQSYNPTEQAQWFGLFPFRSPLLGNRIFFLFLQLLRCFSSLRLPLGSYEFTAQVIIDRNIWVSPFEISGSKRNYRSPKHIGVSPVLHRLLVPRHSPCALHN